MLFHFIFLCTYIFSEVILRNVSQNYTTIPFESSKGSAVKSRSIHIEDCILPTSEFKELCLFLNLRNWLFVFSANLKITSALIPSSLTTQSLILLLYYSHLISRIKRIFYFLLQCSEF